MKDRERLNKGLEIGRDPDTRRTIRIQVEGNLITIAPPRTGRTGGFMIAKLAFPEPNAWAAPAIDETRIRNRLGEMVGGNGMVDETLHEHATRHCAYQHGALSRWQAAGRDWAAKVHAA